MKGYGDSMDLQTLLNQKEITKYHLSKVSGIPKTTIMDICSGESSIQKCAAKTVQSLANALDCTMEDIMALSDRKEDKYDADTGLPMNKEYLECAIPDYLKKAIDKMKLGLKKAASDSNYLHLDCDFCELQSEINVAEVGNEISSEQAWYLREKYLQIERPGDVI